MDKEMTNDMNDEALTEMFVSLGYLSKDGSSWTKTGLMNVFGMTEEEAENA